MHVEVPKAGGPSLTSPAMRHGAALVLGLCLSLPVQATSCLRYDAPAATLRGKVVIKTFYGPPGYGEDPATDRRETQGLLALEQPVCVAVEQADSTLKDELQSLVTLIPPPKTSLKHYRGKLVTVEGSLFQQITGHHHTHVLMDVRHIAKQ